MKCKIELIDGELEIVSESVDQNGRTTKRQSELFKEIKAEYKKIKGLPEDTKLGKSYIQEDENYLLSTYYKCFNNIFSQQYDIRQPSMRLDLDLILFESQNRTTSTHVHAEMKRKLTEQVAQDRADNQNEYTGFESGLSRAERDELTRLENKVSRLWLDKLSKDEIDRLEQLRSKDPMLTIDNIISSIYTKTGSSRNTAFQKAMIFTESESPILNKISTLISGLLDNVQFKINVTPAVFQDRLMAGVSVTNNKLFLNAEQMKKEFGTQVNNRNKRFNESGSYMTKQIMLHESIHLLFNEELSTYLENQKNPTSKKPQDPVIEKALKGYVKLFDKIKTHNAFNRSVADGTKDYAVRDIYELFTEAFSDEQMMKKLMQIEGINYNGQTRNLFEDLYAILVDLFKTILGRNASAHEDLQKMLSDIIQGTEGVVKNEQIIQPQVKLNNTNTTDPQNVDVRLDPEEVAKQVLNNHILTSLAIGNNPTFQSELQEEKNQNTKPTDDVLSNWFRSTEFKDIFSNRVEFKMPTERYDSRGNFLKNYPSPATKFPEVSIPRAQVPMTGSADPNIKLDDEEENEQEPEIVNNNSRESRFINTDQQSVDQFKAILEDLTNRLGVPVFYDNTLKVGGMFKDGRIYLNPDKMTSETVWHEFSHPFIQSVRKFNPALYNQLKQEIDNTPYGQSMMAEVKRLYFDKSEEVQYEETMVELIARYCSGKITKEEMSKPENKSLFDKLKEFLKSIASFIFRNNASDTAKSMNAFDNKLPLTEINRQEPFIIYEANSNLTLNDLANVLKYGGVIIKDRKMLNSNKASDEELFNILKSYYENNNKTFEKTKFSNAEQLIISNHLDNEIEYENLNSQLHIDKENKINYLENLFDKLKVDSHKDLLKLAASTFSHHLNIKRLHALKNIQSYADIINLETSATSIWRNNEVIKQNKILGHDILELIFNTIKLNYNEIYNILLKIENDEIRKEELADNLQDAGEFFQKNVRRINSSQELLNILNNTNIKDSLELADFVVENTLLVSDLKGVFHDVGAYMNNANVDSIKSAINLTTDLLKLNMGIDLACWSKLGPEFGNLAQLRYSFKKTASVRRTFNQDISSNLITNSIGEKIRMNRLDAIKENFIKDVEDYQPALHTNTPYTESFFTMTKNNVETIYIINNAINKESEEWNSLVQLSELTGAPIINEETSELMHQPKPNMNDAAESYESRFGYTGFESTPSTTPSTEQQAFLSKASEANKIGTGEMIEISVSELPKNHREFLEKKYGKDGKTMVYARTDDSEQGKKGYFHSRVSDLQAKIFSKYRTPEEIKKQESDPKSELFRNVGTSLHRYNESMIEWLKSNIKPDAEESRSEFLDRIKQLFAYGEANESFWIKPEFKDHDLAFKQIFEDIATGKSIFETSAAQKDSQSNTTKIVNLEPKAIANAKQECKKLLLSTAGLFYDAYKIQHDIDKKRGDGVSYAPIILTEQFLADPVNDIAGTADMIFVYSDGSASLYDHKFIKGDFKISNENNVVKKTLDKDTLFKKLNSAKRKAYDLQLTKYSEMLTGLYEIKSIRHVRIKPTYMDFSNKYAGKRTKKDETGKEIESAYYDITKDSKITKLYTTEDYYDDKQIDKINMIPLNTEKTGLPKTDAFLLKLIEQMESIKDDLSRRKAWASDFAAVDKHNALQTIITDVQLSGSLKEYTKYLKTYIQNSTIRLGESDSTSVKYLNLEDLTNLLKEHDFFRSFISDTHTLLKEFESSDPTSYQILAQELGDYLIQLESIKLELEAQLVDRLRSIAAKQGMSTNVFDSYSDQTDISAITKLLLSMKTINHPLIRVFSTTIEQLQANRIKFENKIESDLQTLNTSLADWGKSKGISGTDLFKIMLNKSNNLHTKYAESYYNELESRQDLTNTDNLQWFKSKFHRSTEKDISGKSDEERFQQELNKFKDYLDKQYVEIDIQKRVSSDEFKSKILSKDLDAAISAETAKLTLRNINIVEAKEKKLQDWLNRNDITHNNGNNIAWYATRFKSLIRPEEYYNEGYLNLLKPENAPALDYYNYLIAWNYRFRDMMKGDVHINSNFVPNIHRDFIDTMAQNGLSSGMGMFTNYWNSIKNTIMEDPTEKIQKRLSQNGDEQKQIPIMFTNYIKAEDKSIDLGKNLMMFASFVNQYTNAKHIETVGQSVKKVLSITPVVELDKQGNKIIDPVQSNKFKGILTGSTNLMSALDDYIDHYVYGVTTKNDILADTLGEKGTRLVNTWLSYSSKKSMSLNVLSAVANQLNAKAQTTMMASAGKYFNKNQLFNATKSIEMFDKKLAFASHLFQIGSASSTTEKGNMLSMSSFRKAWSKDITYVFQRWTDQASENTILHAMMNNYGIDPVTGSIQRLSKLKDIYQTEKMNTNTNNLEYFQNGKYKDVEIKSLWESMEEVIGPDGEKQFTLINQYTGFPIDYEFISDKEKEDKMIGMSEFEKIDFENKLDLTRNTYMSVRSKVNEIVSRLKGSASAEDLATYRLSLIGRLLGQYKNWIPATMNDRLKGEQYNLVMDEFEVGKWRSVSAIATKSYLSAAGSLIKGLVPFLGYSFNDIDNPKLKEKYDQFIKNNPNLKDTISYESYLDEYKGQLRSLMCELKILIGVIGGSMLTAWFIPDDEEETNIAYQAILSTFNRVSMELGFYMPLPGIGFSEGVKLIEKTPVALINDIKLSMSFIENTFGETIDFVTGSSFGNKTSLSFNDKFGEEIKDSQGVGHNLLKLSGLGPVTKMVGFNDTSDKTDTLWEMLFAGPTRN